MDEAVIIGTVLALLALLLVMPIVALVRSRRIGKLERRLQGVEAALLRVMREFEALKTTGAVRPPAAEQERPTPEEAGAPGAVPPGREAAPPRVPEPAAPAPPRTAPPLPGPTAPAASERPAWTKPAAAAPRPLEEIIGERWLGWIAVSLILFAAAFFLKYAFENRWIGELGRVAIGVMAGLVFIWAGWQRHKAGWRYFSRVLTGGGVTLVYLSTYASYGFYKLLEPSTAFAFLVLVVIQAHLLAVLYNSAGIALMAQIGGFLVPILLSTGRDQYGVLFTYIVLLDLGVVIVSLARRWQWVGAFSFAFTHLLFWVWHDQHYHPEKLAPAVAFQAAVFALFVVADLAPQMRGRVAGVEQWARLLINPFVFFATAYHLLEPEYPAWMGAFALLMATLYAAIARFGLQLSGSNRRTLLVAIGVALTFVTLAIPIQLESNWITIGWAAQGAIMAWLGLKMHSQALRNISLVVFGLAIARQLAEDTPWSGRLLFTPIVNRDFLSALAVVGLLLLAAYLWRVGEQPSALLAAMAAMVLFWAAFSVETYTYFDARVRALGPDRSYEESRQLRWAGQMVLSVLWSLYAAGLVTAGFRFKNAALRWAGLSLFGITLLKVVLVDMSQLAQLYRIVAFLALGLLLLGIAWAYQRIQRREPNAGESIRPGGNS